MRADLLWPEEMQLRLWCVRGAGECTRRETLEQCRNRPANEDGLGRKRGSHSSIPQTTIVLLNLSPERQSSRVERAGNVCIREPSNATALCAISSPVKRTVLLLTLPLEGSHHTSRPS